MRRRLIVVGAAAACVGALATAIGRRPILGPEGGVAGLVTTRTGRNRQLLRVGTRLGGSYALHQARRTFASAARRNELDAEHELRTAEQVADALGNMKGALMKLGQMVSYLDSGLPEPIREALTKLQQDAPPMSGALAATVVEEQLGGHPTTIFAEWDPVPIAAASIGQVHRAITHEGIAVAVKVQYPGVAEAITADLNNADLVFGGLGLIFPGLESGPLVAELRARLLEELDYRLEASNQRLFADYYVGHPFIHIPAVLDGYSTDRVLTTELVDGVRFTEMEAWPQEERDLAAETIFRFVFGSLYRFKAFNGDPHPGNYLFKPGGHVWFLDFGLVKRFTDTDVEHLLGLIRHMVLKPDQAAFRRAVETAGFLQPGAPFSDAECMAYFGHFYEFVLVDEVHTIEEDYATETVRRFFDAGGPHGDILRAANVPPAFVVIQRINLGLYAILARLRATANWRRLGEEVWPGVNGPPSTPMGQAERGWRIAAHRA